MTRRVPQRWPCRPLAWSIGVLLAGSTAALLDAAPRTIAVSAGTNVAVSATRDGRRIVFDLQGTLWLREGDDQRARALTDGLGDDRQPAFAADGSEIAFQSYRSGLWKIWSIRPDGTGLTQLTEGPADDREPVWSPDGRLLAFSSDRAGNYDVWLLDRSSATPRALTSERGNQHSPAFSPGGTELVFVSEGTTANQGDGLVIATLAEPHHQHEIFRTTTGPAGATFTPRTALAAPVFVPDGTAVLVQSFSQAAGRTELLSIDLASGAVRTLSAAGDDVFPFRPAFVAADSGCPGFLFTRNGAIDRYCLATGAAATVPFSVELSFERPGYPRKPRDWDDTITPRPVRGVVAPALSPDGQRVAYTALGDLYLRDVGGSVQQLTDDPAVEAHPRWSPDGNSLTYTSDRDGSTDVYLHDLTTGEQRVLTRLPGGESFPAFSPDGRRVAFFAEEIGRFLSAQLRLVELADGTVSPPLGPPQPPMPLTFSTDGRRVLTTALVPASTRFREGAYQTIEHPLHGGPPRYSTPAGRQTMHEARYAPDDRTLAYVHDGSLWLAAAGADGAFSETRAVLPGIADAPSWSQSGEYLVVLAGDRLRRLHLGSGAVTEMPAGQTYVLPARDQRIVVHAARLFDGRGAEYRHDVDVVIDGRRITAVAPHDDALHRSARVVDARGRTVLPGLTEMHAHQSISGGVALGKRWLAFGVTSVREPGTDPYDGAERRESWASGRRPGPRLFFSGYLLDGSRVYYSIAEGTNNAEHLELALRRAALLDYDLIKTYVRLSDTAQLEVVAAAHRLGIPTSSHEIYPAARSGMDAVEHASATSRRGYSPKQSQLGRVYQDVIDIVAASGIQLTPTLGLPCFWPHLAEHPELLLGRSVSAFLPEQERRAHVERGRAMASAATTARCGEQKVIAEIVRRGGRVTAGTDAPIVPYGLSLHVELQLLVAAGLTPAQALRAATSWAAEAIGVERDLGTVEPGKLADLIVVDGDPLSRIEDTLHLEVTIADGVVYPLEELITPIAP